MSNFIFFGCWGDKYFRYVCDGIKAYLQKSDNKNNHFIIAAGDNYYTKKYKLKKEKIKLYSKENMIHHFNELAKLMPLLSNSVQTPIKIVFGNHDVELQVPLYKKSKAQLFLENNIENKVRNNKVTSNMVNYLKTPVNMKSQII